MTTQNPSKPDSSIVYEYSTETLMEIARGFEAWKSKAGHRQFLHYVLFQHLQTGDHVLDTSCGLGEDAIYLAKQGYHMGINDSDQTMLEKARTNGLESGIRFSNTTHFDWRMLGKTYAGLDAALCVGNSLTYLFDRSDQLEALANFRDILVDTGVLIVDERNYQAMFDRAEDVRQGRFQYTGIYRLAQDNMQLMPVKISEGEVEMQARSNKTDHIVSFGFYPFKRNELLGLLREGGFKTIEQYSDYQPGYNPKADFHQYVVRK